MEGRRLLRAAFSGIYQSKAERVQRRPGSPDYAREKTHKRHGTHGPRAGAPGWLAQLY